MNNYWGPGTPPPPGGGAARPKAVQLARAGPGALPNALLLRPKAPVPSAEPLRAKAQLQRQKAQLVEPGPAAMLAARAALPPAPRLARVRPSAIAPPPAKRARASPADLPTKGPPRARLIAALPTKMAAAQLQPIRLLPPAAAQRPAKRPSRPPLLLPTKKRAPPVQQLPSKGPRHPPDPLSLPTKGGAAPRLLADHHPAAADGPPGGYRGDGDAACAAAAPAPADGEVPPAEPCGTQYPWDGEGAPPADSDGYDSLIACAEPDPGGGDWAPDGPELGLADSEAAAPGGGGGGGSGAGWEEGGNPLDDIPEAPDEVPEAEPPEDDDEDLPFIV
eukprot:TRINITY_DN708_c1_g1_i1.p1 TRINITY_DN708_c1_g1~~TRINITY_DN708_c1_g1_i1.p1  ORF type:complete len:357 (+),score=87.57 TRINITY_DN708_c1_g1_i1:75-1073(+)